MNKPHTRNYPGLAGVHFVPSRRVRRLNISIKTSDTVRVAVPAGMSLKTAVRFFEEHLDWTKKALRKFQRTDEKQRVRFYSGYQTRSHTLVLQPYDKEACTYRIEADKLLFYYPFNHSPLKPDVQGQILPAIIETYRQEAKDYLPGRVARLARRLGFNYNRLFIKNQKSRWGSCSEKNNINLNLQLMRFDNWLIDYIIIHELLHTRIKNHSPKFWSELEKIFPECKAARKLLKIKKPFILSKHLK